MTRSATTTAALSDCSRCRNPLVSMVGRTPITLTRVASPHSRSPPSLHLQSNDKTKAGRQAGRQNTAMFTARSGRAGADILTLEVEDSGSGVCVVGVPGGRKNCLLDLISSHAQLNRSTWRIHAMTMPRKKHSNRGRRVGLQHVGRFGSACIHTRTSTHTHTPTNLQCTYPLLRTFKVEFPWRGAHGAQRTMLVPCARPSQAPPYTRTGPHREGWCQRKMAGRGRKFIFLIMAMDSNEPLLNNGHV